ncbi:MAG: alpha/beta hydrolase [Candidatus Eremiobacteraeota bacterium]|nr:alpha/beta hydrolase [Candidatus Eremiobacteraeota bacterium]
MESASLKTIFIHGAGGRGDVFAAQLAAFADAVAPTLPGHRGETSGPTSIAQFADAVAAEIAALGWSDVLLCGHSMGGAVAMELALRGDARVCGVVGIDTGARMRVAPAFIEAMETDFPAAAQTFAGYFFARDDDGSRVRQAVATMLAVGAEQTIRDLRAVDAFDVTERLANLAVPLLAITGAQDKLTPPKFAQFLADRVPDGEARILEETGHFAMVERPDDINAAILEFANRIALR